MKRMRSRGQNTAEYAVLFAIVIGAAIAMQQYVKSRLQGGIAGTSENYATQSQSLGGWYTFEPDRTVNSASTIGMDMQGAKTGQVNIDSNATTTVTK